MDRQQSRLQAGLQASVQMDFCQRWRDRRASYRPAGELFDPSRAGVELIDDAQAKAFVERHHYSGSYPAARLRAGLFIKPPFGKAELCGVGVFSVPMNQAVVPAYFAGLTPNEGVELGRFVLMDHVAANGESWALARMYRLLRAGLPAVRGLIAYSDPLERRDAQGLVVKRGHVGTIYRATNATYRGLSRRRTLWLAPDGQAVAERALSKVRLGEMGEGYVMDRLQRLGAPARGLAEAGADYIDRLKACRWLTPLRHPGNHTYTWSLKGPTP